MRIDFDHLSATIGELYAGVGDRTGFKAALHSIRTLFSASRVALVTRLLDHECLYYEDRRECKGVVNNAGVQRSAPNEGGSNSPLSPDTKKICSNCLTGQYARRLCCCIADRGNSALPSILLSLHREAGSRPFDESERRALESLGPHVLQAVHLLHRVETTETARNIERQVLEEVRRGVVVLNLRREVVFMNRRAEALCTSARGVVLSRQPSGNRTFKATSTAEALALQRAVDNALELDSTTHHGSRSSDAVRIGGSQSGKMLLFRVARLAPLPATHGKCCAVIFIDDLEVKELGDDRLLTALFGLTRAEARIAGALLAGERPKAIANRFEVSEDTVRTQLRTVYAKTETRGLASLLALLSRLADVPMLDVCDSLFEQKAPNFSDRRQADRKRDQVDPLPDNLIASR